MKKKFHQKIIISLMRIGYILVKMNSFSKGWLITNEKTRITYIHIPHSSCRALLRKNLIEEDKNNKDYFGTVYKLTIMNSQ